MKIKEYKNYILEHKFFEAHETLEEFWFPRRKEKSKKVLIVKGFINAAVAFELKKRGRLENSKKVWQTYLKFAKLIESEDKTFIDLEKFINSFANIYFSSTFKW